MRAREEECHKSKENQILTLRKFSGSVCTLLFRAYKLSFAACTDHSFLLTLLSFLTQEQPQRARAAVPDPMSYLQKRAKVKAFPCPSHHPSDVLSKQLGDFSSINVSRFYLKLKSLSYAFFIITSLLKTSKLNMQHMEVILSARVHIFPASYGRSFRAYPYALQLFCFEPATSYSSLSLTT